mgnify:CR=1 FL=1
MAQKYNVGDIFIFKSGNSITARHFPFNDIVIIKITSRMGDKIEYQSVERLYACNDHTYRAESFSCTPSTIKVSANAGGMGLHKVEDETIFDKAVSIAKNRMQKRQELDTEFHKFYRMNFGSMELADKKKQTLEKQYMIDRMCGIAIDGLLQPFLKHQMEVNS